jgi:hypothetical protein
VTPGGSTRPVVEETTVKTKTHVGIRDPQPEKLMRQRKSKRKEPITDAE